MQVTQRQLPQQRTECSVVCGMYYDYGAGSLDKRVTMEWDGSRSRGREDGEEKKILDDGKAKSRVLMLTASWLPLIGLAGAHGKLPNSAVSTKYHCS